MALRRPVHPPNVPESDARAPDRDEGDDRGARVTQQGLSTASLPPCRGAQRDSGKSRNRMSALPTTLAVSLLAYLEGSLSTAYLLTRALKGADIRELGSRNAGTVNVFREVGPWAGLSVLAVDALKGAAVIFAVAALHLGDYAMFADAMALVIGHNFPAFLGFRGGKGVAPIFGLSLGRPAPFDSALRCPVAGLRPSDPKRRVRHRRWLRRHNRSDHYHQAGHNPDWPVPNPIGLGRGNSFRPLLPGGLRIGAEQGALGSVRGRVRGTRGQRSRR